jgi:flagellar basal-body rod protein FlgF
MTNGLIELGEVMLSASERRLESVSRNIANVSTPGFKKETSFDEALSAQAPGAADASSTNKTTNKTGTDFSQGTLRLTGKSLDLALSGAGFFKLRSQDGVYYSRGGQFERASDGTLSTSQGLTLQTVTGENLVVSKEDFEVLQDGTVLEGGLPTARIGVFETSDGAALQSIGGGIFSVSDDAMRDAPSVVVRQGMLEGSNVELASEMVEMMAALRQAEAGARIVQVFDTLSGQMISTFGQGNR